MSDFTFFALKPEVSQRLHLPRLPVPVRRNRMAAIFPAKGEANLAAILHELEIFISEEPQHKDTYQEFLAMLCYIVAIDAAGAGNHELAASYFRIGLAASPDNISLRSNYGLSLQCAGHPSEALREYERVVAEMPEGKILPVLWMLLARLYAADDEYAKAYRLLRDVSALAPEQPGFWEFLGEMKARAEASRTTAEPAVHAADARPVGKPEQKPSAPVAVAPVMAPRFCGGCGAGVQPGWKFCKACGAPLKPRDSATPGGSH